MSWNKLTTAIVRSIYLFAMYTGIRAVANRALSVFLPVPRASAIDGATIQFDESNSFRIRVHGRIPPSPGDGSVVGGMISVYLEHPGISRILYSFLRVSSHFGCGHIELAFHEEDCSVCVFAVRNMLRSNLHRLGCSACLRDLALGTESDEIVVLTRIFDALRMQGLSAHLAPPAECVNMAVSPRLLKPKTRDRAIKTLTRKYERIAKQVPVHRTSELETREAECSSVVQESPSDVLELFLCAGAVDGLRDKLR